MRHELHVDRRTKEAVSWIDGLFFEHRSKGNTVAMFEHWNIVKKWLLEPLHVPTSKHGALRTAKQSHGKTRG
jgi:hypothetical protein